jgi:hypothetical protein
VEAPNGMRTRPGSRLRIAALAAGLVVLVAALGHAAFLSWIGELPTYPACVAALERVATARTAAEAERYMAQAQASGAWRERPGIDASLAPGQVVTPGTVKVGCRRFEEDHLMQDAPTRLDFLRKLAQEIHRGGLDYTVVEAVVQGDSVRVVRFENCQFGCVDCLRCRNHDGSGDWIER